MQVNRGLVGLHEPRGFYPDRVSSLAPCVLFYFCFACITHMCMYLFIGVLHTGTVHEPRSAQRTDGAARRSTRRSTAGVNKRGDSLLIFASVPFIPERAVVR